MSHIKNNLDIQDHLKDVWMHQSVVYSGDTRLINDQTHKEQYISPLLAAAVIGLNNTATLRPETSKYQDIWTDIDAQEMYLNAKPTCYLILGKPGIGSYGLGEAISKKFHCVHLCPKNIINDEILQGSLTGKCLDFNMKHNNVCSYNTILKMLKQKLKSPAVKHRGYVISGIPLVTASKKPYCLIKTKHSEEAYFNVDEELFDLIYNLKRKKPKEKLLSNESPGDIGEAGEEGLQEEEEAKEEQEEGAEEEEEVAAELPKFFLNTCSDVFVNIKAYFETKQATILHQLQELFNLDLEPDVIIYVTCPDADVVTKHHNKYINYKTGQHTAEPFLTKVTPDIRWPTLYNLSDYENPHDIHVFNPKYNCRPPINFKENSEYQMCNYRHYIFPYIEKKIMDYDPKHVIKLDGRTSIYQMMHQLSERLLLMDINPVIIPEPLYLEETIDDFEEFWQMVEGLKVIHSGVVSFKRCASPWLNRCPVELKRRQSLVGKPKFGVMMFKHVYLMSSLPNFISFCRNPRPYLKLRYLEPTCRFIVIGTKSSGKTMIAECLSWLFDTPVTCFKKFVEAKRENKYLTYSKTILSEIIATIEDARFMEWQQKERNRVASLNEWSESVLALLRKYIPLLKRSIEYTKKKKKAVEKSLTELQEEEEEEQILEKGEQNKDVEEQIIEEGENKELEEQIIEEGEQNKKIEEQIIEEQGPDPTFIEEFNYFREQLSLLLPILDDVDECVSTLENETVSQYAPLALKTITHKPSLPIIGDADVSKGITDYIVANELQKEIEPTTEELMDEMIRTISAIDAEHTQQTNSKELYGKYIIDGLPSDPEYWEFLSSAKLIPDYTIAIMENREIDPELWHYYQNIETCVKIHHEVLFAAKDPLILCKQQTKPLPDLEGVNTKLVRDFVAYHLSKIMETVVSPTTTELPEPDPELLASFTESIEKFREDWDSIKIRLEEKSKCFIEIELENKTDIEVLEQVLLKLRQCYYLSGAPNEDEEEEMDEDESPKDLLSYNNPQNLCETNIYCPFTFYNYGILWEGKREFSLKYDNKIFYFAKEEFLEQFQKDITKYQANNKPFKKLPKLKICIIGCSGSGSSSIAKRIAVELGLIHVDFEMFINLYSMPRHFKKVVRTNENPFTDTPIEEEGVVEFQMNEENPNLLADILSNETEMRRIIFNYYERGQPILPMIMHRIIKRLWYTYPYEHTGFVLDGYPRLLQDVEDLVQCNCIPDIVIELDCSSENVVERLGSIKFKQWKTQLKEAKEAHKTKMADEKKKWNRLITVNVVVRLIIEEIFETLEEPLPPTTESLSNRSFIVDAHPTGSSNVDPNLFKIYNEVIAEYPEPEDTRQWEKPDEERENMESRIEAIFETEYENIQSLKETITDEKINMVTIDATKPFYKVLRIALAKLKNLRNRSESFFEETYIISADIADLLLAQGFCFLSKFGRLCPVSIHENPQIMLNTYKLRYKSQVFPVIHRAYVYFISGGDNVIEFRKNPLKYIISEAIKSYYPYPLRIGVIGTPKSGKSTLAAKLAKRNNLICISRGMALRRVLDNMNWTEMGSRILKNLNDGETINGDLILNAIQTVAIDHRTVTYGFVLDGFPASPYEAQFLAKDGLYPNIIFDLSASKQVTLESSQNEVYHNILKYKPPYSYSFIENRFNKWSEQCYKVRKWINSDYQNICRINANESKWQCLQNAYDNIKDLISKIHYYLANVETSIVSASAMNISNDIFKQKQSKFKNMCPACLRKNVLRYNGCPVDNSGIVQFKNKFYWICSEHMNIVTRSPGYYLFDEIDIPELPAVVSIIHTDSVYQNGICVVTYAEGLPGQKLETGTNKFAATYKHKTYLFCSELCLKNFLEKPHLYSDITIFQGSRWYPRLSLKKLPDLGYLEQTLANMLTKACCSVNAVRPKYPGLGIELSAVIYIALYLKIHNPNLPQAQLLAFRKAMKLFESRSRLILDLGLRMRSMENPFISYPKCHHGSPKYNSPVESVKGETSPVKISFNTHKDFISLSEYHHDSRESLRVKVPPTYNKC